MSWTFNGIRIYVQTQSFNFAYFCASGLLIVAAVMVFFLKAPHHVIEEAAVKEVPEE